MSTNLAFERTPHEAPAGDPEPAIRHRTVVVSVADGAHRSLQAWASLTGPDGAPVVAALGGISATHVVCDDGNRAGWWGAMAGEGRALDTRSVRVLGLTWPTPAGGTLSTKDHARVLVAVLDRLGIDRLDALVGASYGGMVGLALAAEHPDRVARLVAISAAHRSDPLATAWRTIQRRIVRLGLAHGAGHDALVLARALAMTTYRSREEFEQRFRDAPTAGAQGWSFPVERYLLARGEDYARRTAPERFLALSEALDLHRVEPERIRVPATLVAVRQDRLVPVALMRELAAAYGGPCDLHEIDSLYGHDAFLKEHERLGPLLRDACGRDSHE